MFFCSVEHVLHIFALISEWKLSVCVCLSVTYIEEKEKIKKTEGVCVWGERKPQKV